MWFALIKAIADTVQNTVATYQAISENKKQAKEVAAQYQERANQRAKQAKEVMQQQKTSFLKGGVYFDSGSANAIINESYNTMLEDIDALSRDSVTSQKKLIRQGKTAFWNYIANPAGEGGMNALGQAFSNNTNNNNATFNNNTTTTKGVKVSGGIKGDNTTFA